MSGLWFAPPIVGRRVRMVAWSMGLQALAAAGLVILDLAAGSAYGGLTVGSNPVLLALLVGLVPGTAVLALSLGVGRPSAYRPAVAVELGWVLLSVLLMTSGSLASPGLILLAGALACSLLGPALRREIRQLRAYESGTDSTHVAGPRQAFTEPFAGSLRLPISGPPLSARARRAIR